MSKASKPKQASNFRGDDLLNSVMIPPLDTDCQQVALNKQARLTKPAGALGRLEALSAQLAGMTGNLDWLPTRRAIVVCAGDHGIVAQGVSAYPQAVTVQMVHNFLHGGAAINVLARQMNARVTVVDAGVAAEIPPHADLVIAKIGYGTADFSIGPAMSRGQAEQTLKVGLDVARREVERGLDILVVGDMGIGNTTSASAIIAAITGSSVEQVTGHGTGLNEIQFARKIAVIQRALDINLPSRRDALEKVGGFEIGVMAGLMLGAAAQRIPVIIDGLISTAAALITAQIAPRIVDYLIAGHRSVEPGHRIALDFLGLTPLLDLDLRLGEGTGAVLAMPIVEAAMRTLQEMATFDSAGVDGPS
jgi:nicotinate-nucleotide--dimethylbenzimidazole phosphoribosyltransferase